MVTSTKDMIWRQVTKRADNIIPLQVKEAIASGCHSVKVICEDTDVFALLCHCYLQEEWSTEVLMEGFSRDQTLCTSISKTVERNKEIIPSLLAAHALTGCDTVPMHFGIGKGKALSSLKKVSLSNFDNGEKFIDDGKRFIAECYGAKNPCSSTNR